MRVDQWEEINLRCRANVLNGAWCFDQEVQTRKTSVLTPITRVWMVIVSLSNKEDRFHSALLNLRVGENWAIGHVR